MKIFRITVDVQLTDRDWISITGLDLLLPPTEKQYLAGKEMVPAITIFDWSFAESLWKKAVEPLIHTEISLGIVNAKGAGEIVLLLAC